MTTENIVIVAVLSGTCWAIWIARSIHDVGKQIIKRLDEVVKTLDKIQSK